MCFLEEISQMVVYKINGKKPKRVARQTEIKDKTNCEEMMFQSI